ncbi:hypothetical protein ACFLYX_04075, partial [Chloroflexota bacterium]
VFHFSFGSAFDTISLHKIQPPYLDLVFTIDHNSADVNNALLNKKSEGKISRTRYIDNIGVPKGKIGKTLALGLL